MLGGHNRTGGQAALGTSDTRSDAVGFAAGADCRLTPDTVVGMAVAIGKTRWNTGNPGTGKANVAQLGGYTSTRLGAAYLAGSVAGTWHNTGTERTVAFAGQRLEADFTATSIGGRIEGGYRFGGAALGITPYGAIQVQSLHLPAYTERGGNLALSYAERTATDTRSELGSWFDTRHGLGEAELSLRLRAAWVHNFRPDRQMTATFQTLPGASFTVNGAEAPRRGAHLGAGRDQLRQRRLARRPLRRRVLRALNHLCRNRYVPLRVVTNSGPALP